LISSKPAIAQSGDDQSSQTFEGYYTESLWVWRGENLAEGEGSAALSTVIDKNTVLFASRGGA
jgi:hypothetical protein